MWEWLFERISENGFIWVDHCESDVSLFMLFLFVRFMWLILWLTVVQKLPLYLMSFSSFSTFLTEFQLIYIRSRKRTRSMSVWMAIGIKYIWYIFDLFVVSLENEVQVQWCKGNWVNPIWVKIILSNYRWKTCYVQLSEAAEMTYLTIDRKWPILRMLEIQFPFWPSLGMGSKWVNLD